MIVHRDRNHFRSRPAKKPREVSLRIEEVAFGGDGVGRVNGKVWFVPLTLPGELVRARAIRERKDFVKAELIAVDVPSPHRVTAPCPVYGKCGGCRYQHSTYEHQLRMKKEQVCSVLQRIGRFGELPIVQDVIGMPEPFAYRNRITVHIEHGKIGFHRLNGDGLVEITKCLLAAPEVNEKLARFHRRRAFDGHRTLRTDDTAAFGFRQTNDFMAEQLRAFVCKEFQEGGELFLDVYGGAGFFGKALLEKFKNIVGIDWSEPATLAARADACEREIYFQQDAAEGLRQAREWAAEKGLLAQPGIAAVVDPPSEGLEEDVIAEIVQWNWPIWIYVSCNPATFARDVARLATSYELVRVQPFDMFAQTAEIEVAGVLRARTEEASFVGALKDQC